jgi:hypothetical protein
MQRSKVLACLRLTLLDRNLRLDRGGPHNPDTGGQPPALKDSAVGVLGICLILPDKTGYHRFTRSTHRAGGEPDRRRLAVGAQVPDDRLVGNRSIARQRMCLYVIHRFGTHETRTHPM